MTETDATTETGILVQTTDPYEDLFLADGEYWARSDGSVFVYPDADGQTPLAEIADAYFVSATQATESALDAVETTTTTDDTEVSP